MAPFSDGLGGPQASIDHGPHFFFPLRAPVVLWKGLTRRQNTQGFHLGGRPCNVTLGRCLPLTVHLYGGRGRTLKIHILHLGLETQGS